MLIKFTDANNKPVYIDPVKVTAITYRPKTTTTSPESVNLHGVSSSSVAVLGTVDTVAAKIIAALPAIDAGGY